MSDLSIVCVSYNSADWIELFLSSLPAALDGVEAQVVVVDNASVDGSADIVAQKHPEVTLLRNERNLGFAAAVNQGVRASHGSWVLLLNPDMEARPGAVAALYRFALANPGHGLYGGRTLRPDGNVEPSSCWALPTLWSTACFALGLSTVFRGSTLFDPEAIGDWHRDSVREVGMITGCLLLVPRAVWDGLRGLDERYFVYGEDVDFSRRARDAGYRPLFTPAAELVHAIGASSSSGSRTSLVLAGKITYARAHLPHLAVQLLRLAVALRALGSRLTGRGRKWLQAWQRREEWWNGFVERPAAVRDATVT